MNSIIPIKKLCTKPSSVLLLILIIIPGLVSPHAQLVAAAATTEKFVPVGPTEYRVMNSTGELADAGGRRRLSPFQLCLLCKCCAGPTNCLSMPCCFGIDCHLPNKPFGVCSFVPKVCNCYNCHS